MIDWITAVGLAVWAPFWTPVLAWTCYAAVIYPLIASGRRLSPAARRDALTALLLALPIGLAAGVFAPMWGGVSVPAISLPESWVTLETATPGSSPSESPSIMSLYTVVGAVTLVAGFLAVVSLIRLMIDAKKISRMIRIGTNHETLPSKPPVTVVTSETAKVPFACGIFRKYIVLPSGDLPGRSIVVEHEKQHHAAGDVVRQWFIQLSLAGFALHPLVHAISRRLILVMETVCDRRTLVATGVPASRYAALLLAYVPQGAHNHHPVGIAMGRTHHELKKRFSAMKHDSRPEQSRISAVAFAAMVFAIGTTVVACTDGERPMVTEAAAVEAEVDQRPAKVRPDAKTDISVELGATGAVHVNGVLTELDALEEHLASLDVPGSVVQLRIDDEAPMGSVMSLYQALRNASAGALRTTQTLSELPPPPPPKVRPVAGSEVFVVVEEMPRLRGGLDGLQQKLHYPNIAKRAGIEGRVIVQFIVDTAGEVTDVEVVRGLGSGLDEEAVRVVSAAQFVPGRQRDRAVKVKMSLPVTFKLDDQD